jgi:hypothetical protein
MLTTEPFFTTLLSLAVNLSNLYTFKTQLKQRKKRPQGTALKTDEGVAQQLALTESLRLRD